MSRGTIKGKVRQLIEKIHELEEFKEEEPELKENELDNECKGGQFKFQTFYFVYRGDLTWDE